MTTKDLSRELCEICGIKPIIRCATCPYFDIDASGCMYPLTEECYEQYPDFERPKNFVKLLELKIKTKKREVTLCEILHLEYGFANRFEFLKYLKSHLAGTKYFFRKLYILE